ncbi:hypothetical protein HJG60_009102 [Phyllostomus discolor]|uniref:Uncharacterized protein n=1 Tax=Phyllostomus discolor TaxID=89673 RepID=A0A833YPU7_9CHIR|nr:hypothetical protein HJG60_009102 [Phyllostomus discolor]
MECEGHLELLKRWRMKYILVTEEQECIVDKVAQLRDVALLLLWQGAQRSPELVVRRGWGVQVQVHSRSIVYIHGNQQCSPYFHLFLTRFYLRVFREKGGRNRGRDIDQLLLSCPYLGTCPTTQACALTRN